MSLIKDRRVLVTGGAGFIGSNLVGELLAGGNDVVCLDNFSTGRRENLAAYLKEPRFHLIAGDLNDAEACWKAVDGVEYVFHQGALGSVPRSINDPVASTRSNVTGFVTLLFAAWKAGVRRVVYASSSSVYGDCMVSPKVEEKLGRPISPYAMTKRVDELFAENFATVYGLETVGLRYFNVFGPHQTPYSAYAALIPKFALAFIQHERPVINGDGSVSRDFTYIANVVLANQLAMLVQGREAVNTVYNVACGDQTSVKDIFYQLRGHFAKYDSSIGEIEPVYGPPRKGDVPFSLADIGKARRLLGYEPVCRFSEGLEKASAWYWENLQ